MNAGQYMFLGTQTCLDVDLLTDAILNKDRRRGL